MFISITKKQIISLVMIVFLFFCFSFAVKLSFTKLVGNVPNVEKIIVLDPGHGGIDVNKRLYIF